MRNTPQSIAAELFGDFVEMWTLVVEEEATSSVSRTRTLSSPRYRSNRVVWRILSRRSIKVLKAVIAVELKNIV